MILKNNNFLKIEIELIQKKKKKENDIKDNKRIFVVGLVN